MLLGRTLVLSMWKIEQINRTEIENDITWADGCLFGMGFQLKPIEYPLTLKDKS